MKEVVVYDSFNQQINTLVQWDRDVYIHIEDSDITDAYEVHFFNTVSTLALVVESSYSDGILTVKVPNDLLTESRPITGYIYVSENDEQRSIYIFKLYVRQRPMPSNALYEDTKDYIYAVDILESCKTYATTAGNAAIAANKAAINAATSAEEAAASAESANTSSETAGSAASAATTAANNAQTYAEEAAASAESANTSSETAGSAASAATSAATTASKAASSASAFAANAQVYATNAATSAEEVETNYELITELVETVESAENDAASSAKSAAASAESSANSAAQASEYATGDTESAKYFYELTLALAAASGVEEAAEVIQSLIAGVTRTLTIPAGGWEIDTDIYDGVYIDIDYDDVTESMVPIVAIPPDYMDIAKSCGLSTVAQTIDGAVRLFAKEEPASEIEATLTLILASSGTASNGNNSSSSSDSSYTLPAATATTLGGVKIGDGLSVTSDGTLSVDTETLTDDLAADDESVDSALDEIYSTSDD